MLVLIAVITIVVLIVVFCCYCDRNSNSCNGQSSMCGGSADNSLSRSDLTSLRKTIIEATETFHKNKVKHGVDIELENDDKVYFFGDIHGDLKTLKAAFKLASSNKANYYVFCGDYIDRGDESVACLKFALNAFIHDPKHVVLLCGNHEKNFIYSLRNAIVDAVSKHDVCYDLTGLCEDLFDCMPLACLIKFKHSHKQIFCSHGAYPFMYTSPSYIYEDKFADVWRYLGFEHLLKMNSDAGGKYEDNNSLNMTPTEYINKAYDDVNKLATNIIESPCNYKGFKQLMKFFDTILDKNANESDKKDVKDMLLGKGRRYLMTFIDAWCVYKNYIVQFENAKQKLSDLMTYITWGDMYVDSSNTQFVKSDRHLDKQMISYPLEQLKTWMTKSSINVFIRGHQMTSDMCQVYDLNSNIETSAPATIDFKDTTMTYVGLHTTMSYSKFYPDAKFVPKILKLNGDKLEVIGVSSHL